MSGLTNTGFSRKRLADIKIEIEERLKDELGDSINLVAPSIFATLVGILAEREASIWELAESVYNSQYPDTATGNSLDNAVAFTGLIRRSATKSIVQDLHLFGTVGTTVPAGTQVSVSGNESAIFETDNSVTLVAGVDEVQTISFVGIPASGGFKLTYEDETTAVIDWNDAAADVQSALRALSDLSEVEVTGSFAAGFTITFSGADGKINQPLLVVTDNTLQTSAPAAVTANVVQTIAGVPQGTVDCTAVTAGATQAPARTLTVIESPVSGLNSVLNLEDATVGRNLETDADLRARRLASLQIAGAGTVEAIQSGLANLDGVTAALVFENDTLIPDADGRPSKSFEAVVAGGIVSSIAEQIWKSKPAGISTFGSRSDNITDSQGNTQTINWSRPTNVNIYLEVDLTTDANFPDTGLADAETALLAVGNAFGIGSDVVVYPTLISALNNIPGILDVAIRIGTTISPLNDDNVNIDADEIAVFDSSRTTVTEI